MPCSRNGATPLHILPVAAVCVCRYKQDNVPPDAQGVTPLPETTQVQVDTLAGAPAGAPEAAQMGMADFLVLACDGLWDCMSNQQVRARQLDTRVAKSQGRCTTSSMRPGQFLWASAVITQPQY